MAAEQNVVDMLVDQHVHIRKLFEEVESTAGEKRRNAFEELRRFLAAHEAAEEIITHPTAKAHGNDEVVEERLGEEHEAKKLLSDLDGLDQATPEFDVKLATFKAKVLAHAEAEEREEFPLLRAEADAGELDRMAEAVKAMEEIAPTHPHPGVGESAMANLMAGPVASIVDRTKDAVSAAMRRR